MLALLVGLIIFVGGLFFLLKRTHDRNSRLFTFFKKFGDVLYIYVAGFGIVAAALLYVSEKQWAPRISVDLDIKVAGSGGKSENDFAVVQTVLSLTNLGRTSLKIANVRYALLELDTNARSVANKFGDLPARNYSETNNAIVYEVDAGETDRIYFESSISCDVEFARVIVKVPKPGGRGINYERKAILPISKMCRDGRPVEQVAVHAVTGAVAE